jgi:hypothetical protein
LKRVRRNSARCAPAWILSLTGRRPQWVDEGLPGRVIPRLPWTAIAATAADLRAIFRNLLADRPAARHFSADNPWLIIL